MAWKYYLMDKRKSKSCHGKYDKKMGLRKHRGDKNRLDR